MNTLATAFGQHKFADVIAAALTRASRSRSEEYRAHAAECRRIADRWSDPVKHQYEELARQWMILAEQAGGAEGLRPMA